jgi:hypothetical protein
VRDQVVVQVAACTAVQLVAVEVFGVLVGPRRDQRALQGEFLRRGALGDALQVPLDRGQGEPEGRATSRTGPFARSLRHGRPVRRW